MPELETGHFLHWIDDAFAHRAGDLGLSTRFRELKEWDSMVSVFIVAGAYEHHNVQVSGEDLVSCTTLGDLKSLIESRLSAES